MADEDKTITIKFRGDSTQLDNTTSNIDKMIKLLAYDTKALEKQMKFGGDYRHQMSMYQTALSNVSEEIRLADVNMQSWNAEMEEYSKKLKEQGSLSKEEWNSMNRAMKQTAEYSKMVENLKQQYERLATAKINYNKITIAEALEKERKKAELLGNSVGKIADSFKYVSVAAGAALTASAAAAISFEDAMANVRKVLKPEDETYFDAIRQDVLNLSKALPITANEIAKVAANALQLGVSASDVSKFTETVLKLGTATDIAADEAALSIARFFNITQSSLQEVDAFGATLTHLGNNFATGEAAIMEMAARLAAAGSIAGMTTDEILALSTALSSMNLGAEAGGSAISTIIRSIGLEVSTSGDHLEAFAEQARMSAKEFSAAWEADAGSTFQTLVNGIARSVKEGDDLNVILKNLGINAIRQTDAFSRLVLGVDTYNNALSKAGEAWAEVEKGEKGALNTEVENRIGTIATRWQMLVNSVTRLGVEIGDSLKPTLKTLIDYAQRLVNAFSNLTPETKAWVVSLLAGVATIYPALKGIQKLILGWRDLLKGIAGLVRSTIVPFTSWVKDSAFIKFSDSMKVAMLNIKKLGAAFGDFLVKIFSGKAQMESFEIVGNFGVGDALSKVISLMTALKAVAVGLAAAFVALYATNEQFRESINRIVTGVLERLKVQLDGVLATLRKVGGWLSEEFSDLIEKLVELWKTYLEPALSYLLVALSKLAGDVLVDLTGVLGGLVKILIVSLANILEFIIDAVRALATLLSPLIATLSILFGKVVEFVTWAAEKLRPGLTWLLSGMEQIGELIVGFVIVAFDALARAIEWVGIKLGELFNWFKQIGIVEGFIAVVTKIKDVFEGIVNRIGKALEKLRDLIGLFNSNAPSLGDMIGNGRYGGTSTIGNITVRQTNTFNGTTTSATQQAANNLLDMVNNGIGKQLDTRGW